MTDYSSISIDSEEDLNLPLSNLEDYIIKRTYPLPIEILWQIFHHCTLPTVDNFACTSKSMNSMICDIDGRYMIGRLTFLARLSVRVLETTGGIFEEVSPISKDVEPYLNKKRGRKWGSTNCYSLDGSKKFLALSHYSGIYETDDDSSEEAEFDGYVSKNGGFQIAIRFDRENLFLGHGKITFEIMNLLNNGWTLMNIYVEIVFSMSCFYRECTYSSLYHHPYMGTVIGTVLDDFTFYLLD